VTCLLIPYIDSNTCFFESAPDPCNRRNLGRFGLSSGRIRSRLESEDAKGGDDRAGLVFAFRFFSAVCGHQRVESGPCLFSG